MDLDKYFTFIFYQLNLNFSHKAELFCSDVKNKTFGHCNVTKNINLYQTYFILMDILEIFSSISKIIINYLQTYVKVFKL